MLSLKTNGLAQQTKGMSLRSGYFYTASWTKIKHKRCSTTEYLRWGQHVSISYRFDRNEFAMYRFILSSCLGLKPVFLGVAVSVSEIFLIFAVCQLPLAPRGIADSELSGLCRDIALQCLSGNQVIIQTYQRHVPTFQTVLQHRHIDRHAKNHYFCEKLT